MAIVSTYSVSTASNITLSTEYSTLDELLIQIPDNTSNSITAEDVRDSVYTLWQKVESVNIIAASAASASAFFQNANPTPLSVGGIPAGSTFPTPTDMQTMWNQLLYPYVPPTAALSLSLSPREYGASLGVTLDWSVTRNSPTNPIISITVDGAPQLPTGNSQTGTKAALGTFSWTGAGSSATNTFTMAASDDVPTIFGASTTLTWMNKRYWGRINLSSIGNPNLTTNPGSASVVASLCTDTLIKALNGAGVGSGNELSTSKNKTYTGINGNGWHLIFAWPSSVAGALTPTFTVNGLPNTAFTRVRTASPFVGIGGFTTNFEVWVSNTLQNSPLNIVIS
jgi:hypothetical protein